MPRKRNVVKFKKKFNIGTVIVGVICIYILSYTILYFLKDKPSIYKVVSDIHPDTIQSTGIIIRKEKVFTAKQSGYINYYIGNNSRINKNGIVCTIDKTGTFYSKFKSKKQNTSDTELMDILRQFQLTGYDNFYNIYNLKDSLNDIETLSSGKFFNTSLKKEFSDYAKNNSFELNYADDSGIVVYGTDSFENLTVDSFAPSVFDKKKDCNSMSSVKDGKIEEGEPVYKLITDEKWQIIVPIDEEQKNMLEDLSFVDVIVDNKPFTAKAKVDIKTTNQKNYLVLTFYNYMVNYTNKRFVDVYINLKNVSGLKIPKSSVVERQVFEIPKKFLTRGGGSLINSKGFAKISNSGNMHKSNYVEVDICYATKNSVYVTDDYLKSGDQLTAPDSGEIFIVSKTKTFKGVYNINKGYPRFKHVEPEEIKGSDYYLIPDTRGFLLYEYDNIILNPDE